MNELENNWKRALADYKNLERRVEEEKDLFAKFANTALIMRILPILDNLHAVCIHNNDEGLKMIIKEFEKILNEEGVKEIKAEGEKFDPKLMDAIEIVEGKKDKVVEVTQKGYTLKGKVIRPARVKVGGKGSPQNS